jgi:hypothetical protein
MLPGGFKSLAYWLLGGWLHDFIIVLAPWVLPGRFVSFALWLLASYRHVTCSLDICLVTSCLHVLYILAVASWFHVPCTLAVLADGLILFICPCTLIVWWLPSCPLHIGCWEYVFLSLTPWLLASCALHLGCKSGDFMSSCPLHLGCRIMVSCPLHVGYFG